MCSSVSTTFERALTEDGDYDLAHAGLADAYVILCSKRGRPTG